MLSLIMTWLRLTRTLCSTCMFAIVRVGVFSKAFLYIDQWMREKPPCVFIHSDDNILAAKDVSLSNLNFFQDAGTTIFRLIFQRIFPSKTEILCDEAETQVHIPGKFSVYSHLIFNESTPNYRHDQGRKAVKLVPRARTSVPPPEGIISFKLTKRPVFISWDKNIIKVSIEIHRTGMEHGFSAWKMILNSVFF